MSGQELCPRNASAKENWSKQQIVTPTSPSRSNSGTPRVVDVAADALARRAAEALRDGDDLLVAPGLEQVLTRLAHICRDQQRRGHRRPHRELRAGLRFRLVPPRRLWDLLLYVAAGGVGRAVVAAHAGALQQVWVVPRARPGPSILLAVGLPCRALASLSTVREAL